jgi:hypothetical protein
MIKNITKIVAAGVLTSSLLLVGGCVRMPTEMHNISDMRPQISFKADSTVAKDSRILVDGLDMGLVSDYLEGKAAVRVLSGSHIVSVTSGGTVLLEEKVYLGDGVSRTFIIK